MSKLISPSGALPDINVTDERLILIIPAYFSGTDIQRLVTHVKSFMADCEDSEFEVAERNLKTATAKIRNLTQWP